MISVQLVSGDWTHGRRRHRHRRSTATTSTRSVIAFWPAARCDLPFARAEVLTLLPNLHASFKISAAQEWMGSITEDRNTAVSGMLGKRAPLVPLEIKVGERRIT